MGPEPLGAPGHPVLSVLAQPWVILRFSPPLSKDILVEPGDGVRDSWSNVTGKDRNKRSLVE